MKYKIYYKRFDKLKNKIESLVFETTATNESNAVIQFNQQFYNDFEFYFYIDKVELNGKD